MPGLDRNFDERVRRIEAGHRPGGSRSVFQMREDGLIVPVKRRNGPRLSPRGVLYLLAVVFLFKGLAHAHLGAETYSERVSGLAAGSVVEQAGAVVMQADPVTLMVSRQLAPVFR